MRQWNARPIEEANLFNPAFCGGLISLSVGDFRKKADQSMSFALAFLVLPIVLHRGTREALPGSVAMTLLSWLQENRDQLVDFPDRVRRMRPITQEAIMFGLLHRALLVDDDGGLVLGPRRLLTTDRSVELFTPEALDCVRRARFLGRWFAGAGTPATVFASWGVMP